MSRQIEILGQKITIDPMGMREKLQKRAEKGEIRPLAYYKLLKLTCLNSYNNYFLFQHMYWAKILS